jgi:putative inorganic carbon (hco3(-)) transporter
MITRFARFLIEWELLWVILLAPLLFFPGSGRGIAIVALPFLWLLRWVAWRRFVPHTPIDWALFLLLVMVGVSLWATFDPAFSFPKVTGVLLGVTFFYALVERGVSGRGVLLAVSAFLAVSVAMAAISLFTIRWTSKFSIFGAIIARLPNSALELPGGPSDGFNPNGVAGALLFAVPLLLVLVWPYRNATLSLLSSSGRWLAYLLVLFSFGLVAGVMLLTQSRGGYLGLLAGLTALLLPRPRLLASIGVVALVILLVGVRYGSEPLLRYFDEKQTAEVTANLSTNVTTGVQSLEDRGEIWTRALYVIRDFPFTGVGMGTFRLVVPILYPLFTISPNVDIGHAHNHFLAAAVDVGLPGLIAYLALWFGVAGMCWQIWRSALPYSYRLLGLGLGAGFVANFVWALTDANVLGAKAGFPFWLALGAMGALHRYSGLQQTSDV